MNKRSIARLRAMTRNVSTSTTAGLWICILVSIGLFITSLFLPPQGEVDPSVIKAVGYLFAFAALIELREAIREGLGFRISHGQTTVEVKDLDGMPKEDDNDKTDDNEEA